MEQRVSKLIELAKEVGGQAWPILVQNQFVRAWTGVGFGLALMALAGAAFGLSVRESKKKYPDTDLVSFCAVGGLLVALVGICFIGSNISGVIYPEGEALRVVFGK